MANKFEYNPDEHDLSSMLRKDLDSFRSSGGLTDHFVDYPVPLETWWSDRKWLGNPGELSAEQYKLIRHVEQIYLPDTVKLLGAEEIKGRGKNSVTIGNYAVSKSEKYWSVPIRQTNRIFAMWGKGSGKDMSIRTAFLRIFYLLNCLKSPQAYYGVPLSDSIHMLNLAPNAKTAQDAFFIPLTQEVKKLWVRDLCQPTRDQIRFAKNIYSISGHSDADAQEGKNLLASCVDEIDGFPVSRVKSEGKRAGNDPTYVYDMVVSSGRSRFPEVFKAIAISFPRYKASPIMKLVDKGKTDNEEKKDKSRIYVSGPFATWDINPLRTREEFEEQYEDDPIEAAAKYECKPNLALNPYFRNGAVIEGCFEDVEQYPLEVVDYEREGNSWKPVYEWAADFHPIEGAIYAVHGDLAISGDRAGLAMSHVMKYEEGRESVEDEDGKIHTITEYKPIVKNDFVIAFEADKGQAREIQIRWARQLVFELRKRGFDIRFVSFDQFQSADSMQILNDNGIESKRVSADLGTSVWNTLRDVANDNRLIAPKNQLLINEILSLVKNETKNKVDHLADGSKDLADAFACSIVGAIMVGGQEDENGTVINGVREDTFNVLQSQIPLPIGLHGVNISYDQPSFSTFQIAYQNFYGTGL